ncbi:MAG: hypothetical protein HXS46_03790 [Theionarchaea archaeon]|nr:hypothetical protein [Theionarchaea archaeon]
MHNSSSPDWLSKPLKVILLFSVLLMILIAFGTFFDLVTGIGMFFIYIISYFHTLIIVLPILLIKKFGAGTSVYVPSALIGLFVEYYMEWMREPVLISPWCVVGWSVIFLAVGFSADVIYRILPDQMHERNRAILTGLFMEVIHFVLILVAVSFFYIPVPDGESFLSAAYFGLPWLMINSIFGGYTAYALSLKVKSEKTKVIE